MRVRLAAVDGVELILAVEDAPALAGEGGHVEPAESPGQARGFLLTKGSGPPVPSHPRSRKSKSKTLRTLDQNVFKTRVLIWKNNPQM